MTVGTHVDVSHVAAPPPSIDVKIHVTLTEVEGRKLVFIVEARDEIECISTGTHEQFIIYPEIFNQKVEEKIVKANESHRKKLLERFQ